MGINDSKVPITKLTPPPFPSEPGGMAEPLWGHRVPPKEKRPLPSGPPLSEPFNMGGEPPTSRREVLAFIGILFGLLVLIIVLMILAGDIK
jgi:hypothetical protein